MLIKIGTSIATTFTLIALSGGYCTRPPKLITSTGLSADKILPEYAIYEHNSGNKRNCYITLGAPKFSLDGDRNVSIVPPTNVTFQGKILSFTKPADNHFTCEHQTVEFVLIDDKGGRRVDRFNLQQAKFLATKITADRSQDLRISVGDFVYRQGIDIQTSALELNLLIGKGTKEEKTLKVRNFSKKYPLEKYEAILPLFDRDTQTLIIPAAILKQIESKTTNIGLAANISVYNKRLDDSILLSLLTYNYHIPAIEVELK